jgi:hypothetical protein
LTAEADKVKAVKESQELRAIMLKVKNELQG